MMPLLCVAVDFAFRFRLVLQDWDRSRACAWLSRFVAQRCDASWGSDPHGLRFGFGIHRRSPQQSSNLYSLQTRMIEYGIMIMIIAVLCDLLEWMDEKYYIHYAFGPCESIFYYGVKLYFYTFSYLSCSFYLSFHSCLPIFLSPNLIYHYDLKEDSTPSTVLK